MLYVPKPFHVAALDFLYGVQRANFFSDPGTGKTGIMLDLIHQMDWQAVLVVASKYVAANVWPQEAQKWDHLKGLSIRHITGSPKDRAVSLLAPPRICVVHPELLVWLTDTLDGYWPWKVVIYDESTRLQGFRPASQHAPKVGSLPGRSTKRAARLSQYAFDKVTHWYNLSGLAVANSYLQLWGPQWFLDQGAALGKNYSDYRWRWFMQEPRNGPQMFAGPSRSPWLLKPGAERVIAKRLAPTTISIRAKDWFPLSDPQEHTLWVELPATARQMYRDMQRTLTAQSAEGAVTAVNAGVKTGKLRQIASGAVYRSSDEEGWVLVHLERIEALKSLVAELAGAPLLVVIQYRHERELIHKHMPQVRDVTDPGVMERWNKGELPLVVLNARNAGHGLNLQDGGHHICYYSPYSDNELYSQVLERIGPMRQLQSGYDRVVQIYHIEARQTVDKQTRDVREGRIDAMEAFRQATRIET